MTTPDTPAVPDWLYPGARVAIHTVGHRGGRLAVRLAMVEKVGKRDVVLDNEERFNVNRLSRREGGAWGWTVYLRPRDHPDVQRDLAYQGRQQALVEAVRLLGQWLRSGDPAQAAEALDVIWRVLNPDGPSPEPDQMRPQVTQQEQVP